MNSMIDAIVAAQTKLVADRLYEKAIRTHMGTIPHLDKPMFWEIEGRIAHIWARFGYQVSISWSNFFCTHVYQTTPVELTGLTPARWGNPWPKDGMARWEQMCGYWRAREALVRELFEQVRGWRDMGRSDDTCDDLADGLPLLGKDICDLILSGVIDNYSSLKWHIHQTKKLSDGGTMTTIARKAITEENYIGMHLQQELESAFLQIVFMQERESA